jgi:hypothetical protein
MKEEWRAVAGHPGYEVSNRGRARSLPRWVNVAASVRAPSYRKHYPGKLLRPIALKSTGYVQVYLRRRVQVTVHRLVAIAFLGPPPFPKAQVNHIDNNRANNRLRNLEWVTPSQNQKHSYATTNRVPPDFGKFGKEHKTSIPVVAICMRTGRRIRYGAAMDAVRSGFRSDGISRACAGKIAHHKGFRWEYAKGRQGRTQNRNSPRFTQP